MKKRIVALLLAILLAPTAFADQKALKAKMLKDLDALKTLFETDYAPAEWKKSFFGWSLQTAINDAKDRVKSCDSMTIKGYHQILRDLFNSMKDYHVGIRFHSTEKSVLPFQIKGADGRYFFVYLDRDFLPEKSFPFKEGDELIQFGEISTGDAVREFRKMLGNNASKTDEALAEILLTRRSGKAARTVQKGPIMLTIRRKGTDKLVRHQLIWDYAPEKINYDVDFVQPDKEARIRGEHRANFFDKKMMTPYWTDFNGVDLGENPHLLGSKVGFIPALGEKVWQSSAENSFDAYIYQTEGGKKIGYLRIPHYDTSDGSAFIKIAYFQELIARFSDETDALVIDQMNNPGGSVFYLYAVASMLTDQALLTPRHRMTITQADVFEAYETLPNLEKIKNDEEAVREMGDSLSGYPVTYQMIRYFIEYCRFIIAEWNAGRTLTHSYYLMGVDAINPAPVHYAKPILLLVNSLDFSGGDFFPAILQDNKRVTVLGTRTAGAGGYVLERKYPNQFGIDFFTVTGSIAERASQLPIENLGVAPDIEYEVTAEDLQNNYADYVATINRAVADLLQ
ncbi:MAG: protease-like activity factor CPAF [Deltaproteobacteria bacterium]|nr:protease-like activity factor CPAF [Deltaproteobacteria bacterium]